MSATAVGTPINTKEKNTYAFLKDRAVRLESFSSNFNVDCEQNAQTRKSMAKRTTALPKCTLAVLLNGMPLWSGCQSMGKKLRVMAAIPAISSNVSSGL